MADFPFGQSSFGEGSVAEYVDGLTLTRASNGAVRGRNLFTARKSTFKLLMPYLTSAQKTTLVSFYDTNRNLSFNLTWIDGAVYVVLFSEPPRLMPHPGGWFDASVSLTEV